MQLRKILAVIGALALPLWSTSASATLLFSGGEDTDLNCAGSGTCFVSTTSTRFRAPWAREAIAVNGPPTLNDPIANRWETPLFAANSTIWVHAQLCDCISPGATTSNVQLLRIMDTAGNATLLIRGTGVQDQIKISSRTASGTFTDLVTCSDVVDAKLEQLDVRVNYGTTGEVTLYKNSVQVCDFSGNVTNGDGAVSLNGVEFGSPTTNSEVDWSEIIVATTDTRAMARFTANTVANGNSVGFSGTNICSTIWNATTVNDNNFGFSGSPNVSHECTIRSAVPNGSYNVLGLQIGTRAVVGSSGPQHFDFLMRTNGNDYPSSDFAPTTTFSNISTFIQTTNPATGNPWTLSDLQAVDFNVGLETKP